jgi:SAM-dependent methyltransferase
MSTPPPSDQTIAYYDRNAAVYAQQTLAIDMGPLYGPFLELVPAGGYILDAGCGSGRDTREFKRRGYKVTAIDASPELARLAGKVIGQTVRVVRLEELTYEDAFDGLWACASLLHVPRGAVDDVLARLTRALRVGGAWYMSFKVGDEESVRDGRLFNDHTEESLGQLLRGHPRLRLVRAWRTQDPRPGRSEQSWLNALVRRGEGGGP